MGFEVGAIVEGKVTGVTKFGAFVTFEDNKVGLVHISEISNTFVKLVTDHVKEGQTVKVKILNIGDGGKIELSMKQAQEPVFRKMSPKREILGNKRPVPVNNFEDMMSKFKKLSDEKLEDFKEKTKFRRG